jgi:hypothetical protein
MFAGDAIPKHAEPSTVANLLALADWLESARDRPGYEIVAHTIREAASHVRAIARVHAVNASGMVLIGLPSQSLFCPARLELC